MPRIAVVLLVGAAVLGACGAEEPTTSATGTSTTKTTQAREDRAETPDLKPPPAVTVRNGEKTLELRAWTYCYGNGCADGMPPAELPDIGRADELTVEFPLPDWSFLATFSPADSECPREHTIPLTANGDGTFRLTPAGHAGTYDVTLSGQGNGDLFVSFRWTTGQDGPLPTPKARLAVVADHDGRPDSYGVELMLSNLAATPADASATITVRAGNGEALTFDATRMPDCLAEGTVYWDGPDDQGLAAAALGEPPFTYEVAVVVDGVHHTAEATWPDDQIVGNEPSVALEFTPPLPPVD